MGTRAVKMVIKKVKSLIDGEISTYFESRFVVVDEVLVLKFKNKDTFASYIQLGVLVEAKEDERVSKSIPIIPTEVDESGLSFVGEDVEEIPIEEQEESKSGRPNYFGTILSENKFGDQPQI